MSIAAAEQKTTLVGKGREAIALLVDENSFAENLVGGHPFAHSDIGPGAVVGTATAGGVPVTVIATDARAVNPRFPVVRAGIIGMEEAHKMAMAVYATIAADAPKPAREKRPLLLVVDSPGNGPGKQEEIFGMNKATGAYQLALTEARLSGHPVIAVIVGRAISGAFLCHGLQADRILTLSSKFGTMVHVMPLSSIARITKMDIEKLAALSKTNPVFASGAEYFYNLGGVEEVLDDLDALRPAVVRNIAEVYAARAAGNAEQTGPCSRGLLGTRRGGRAMRAEVLHRMNMEFEAMEPDYL